MKKINLVISGCMGRMGQQLIKSSKKNKNFRILKSIRFEYYLQLLKFCKFIIGNSSSGIIEAPHLNTYCINVGTRQKKRIKANEFLFRFL